MQKLSIPQQGDEVEYFMTFDGDDEVTGPLAAIVLIVDLISRPYPLLDLRVCYPYEQLAIVRRVPFREGKHFWLPEPVAA